MVTRNFHLALSLCGLLACVINPTSTSAASADEISWTKAVVVIDNYKERLKLGSSEAQAKLAAITTPKPVYVFFHGSGGINAREVTSIANVMARAGWIVIAPESQEPTGFQKDHVKSNHRDRLKEIDYAMNSLLAAPWADKSKIVFHGQSAGAIALADYNDPKVAALVFTGFNCQWLQKTIDGPKNIPVLSMQDPNDPTFGIEKGVAATYGTCKEQIAREGRPNSKVVAMQNFGHKILYHVEARRELRAFMQDLGLMDKAIQTDVGDANLLK